MTTIVRTPKPRTGKRHWHPLINAAIQMGGIRPVKDKTTGRLADEYQELKYMPGLLNKRGLALDEMARTILEEYPSLYPYIETDCFDGNLYPEDLRYALECAMRQERPGEREEWPPEDEEIDADDSMGLSDFYEFCFAQEGLKWIRRRYFPREKLLSPGIGLVPSARGQPSR